MRARSVHENPPKMPSKGWKFINIVRLLAHFPVFSWINFDGREASWKRDGGTCVNVKNEKESMKVNDRSAYRRVAYDIDEIYFCLGRKIWTRRLFLGKFTESRFPRMCFPLEDQQAGLKARAVHFNGNMRFSARYLSFLLSPAIL